VPAPQQRSGSNGNKLAPAQEAWDLLSVALSAVVADGTVRRSASPDGWTRQLDLEVATADPDRWAAQAGTLADALGFLTTDLWQFEFRGGAKHPPLPKKPHRPESDSVVLLSGGLDSLIGAIDLHRGGSKLLAVSQTVRGDGDNQKRFASIVGGGSEHLQLNHNASTRRSVKETSQRSRSLIFLAFAALAATTTERYHGGETVPLYICENGFIAINPPLTNARLGSLSTRTAHPRFLSQMQDILDALDLRIEIRNPYAQRTKGEMLSQCLDQDVLKVQASVSTSCGRFQRYNYQHCGRCVPCQIRRSAFIAWGVGDDTSYVYTELGRQDEDHAAFDDVRSVAMALASVKQDGMDRWLGASLSSPRIYDPQSLRDMVRRGLAELSALHAEYGVS
jgi:7-cyano-7-deazaguanine synthase in queuosine biosynthesis